MDHNHSAFTKKGKKGSATEMTTAQRRIPSVAISFILALLVGTGSCSRRSTTPGRTPMAISNEQRDAVREFMQCLSQKGCVDSIDVHHLTGGSYKIVGHDVDGIRQAFLDGNPEPVPNTVRRCLVLTLEFSKDGARVAALGVTNEEVYAYNRVFFRLDRSPLVKHDAPEFQALLRAAGLCGANEE